MKSYPLTSLTVSQAADLQFRIVDAITRQFDGVQVLIQGDLGIPLGLGKPMTTKRVEAVIAEIFDAEAAVLVRGAGTGALRWSLASMLRPGNSLLVHKAPIYPTTGQTLKSMGVHLVHADFNDHAELSTTLSHLGEGLSGALVQHTRQNLKDSYHFGEVIQLIKQINPSLPVITDDNYAALKVPSIGCGYGADLSAFSCFKLLGPEGIGAVVGGQNFIDWIVHKQYSGGSQVQGHEAMDVLRGMVYAPVSLAISAQVCEETYQRLKGGEIPEVKNVYIVNAQSKVLIVEFNQEIADQVLELTPQLGAAAHPVGCESKYEMSPLIYRISATFRAEDPSLEKRMIRINPLRSGSDTIIRILRGALDQLKKDE